MRERNEKSIVLKAGGKTREDQDWTVLKGKASLLHSSQVQDPSPIIL